jgi:signal transduction histidine kinase
MQEVSLSHSGRIAILLAGLAAGVGVELLLYLDGTLPSLPAVALALVVGWSFVASGVVAWSRRPDNRTGALMILVGFLWFLGLLGFAEQDALYRIGDLVGRPLQVAVFVYLLLAFPTGRLETRGARVLAGAAFVDACIVRNSSRLFDDDRLAGRLYDASEIAIIVIFLGIIGVLARRWRAGSGAWRRAVGPLLWPGALALSMLILFFANDVAGEPLGTTPAWLYRIAYAVLPLLFLAGLLRMRLARAGVAELLLQLERPQPAADVRDAIARALGDPTVDVLYWLPDEKRYVDRGGRPAALPRDDPQRAATLVERDGRRVAAIVHEEVLSNDPELLRAVSAAAALALENARLQAELRARLEELEASRARSFEAADLERKRIERNLHDATQQRLTSVALALGLAESRLASDPRAARESIAQAKQALAAALAELRDLSRDIHPSVLTEGGLRPALEDLAYTTPLPVRIAADLNGRLPEHVEATAYYVIAEALTNVAKHADASRAVVTIGRENERLAVSVRDDGVGGAAPGDGSGLRGLADRVGALGGTFEVESDDDRGTEIRAWIPCA